MKYIAAAVAALVLSLPAQATLHVYEFTASVAKLGHVEAFEWAQSVGGIRQGSVISLGDSIVGRFSYDTSIASTSNTGEREPNAPSTIYYYPDTASATNFLNFTILPSGQTIGTGETQPKRAMSLGDGKPGSGTSDVLWISDGTGFNTGSFGISMDGLSSDWVKNGQLPVQLSFAELSSGFVYHNFVRDDGHRIMLNATLTSLKDITVTAVPEPGTWALMLAGLGLLAFTTRRQRG
jgi:hypothetical protein